MNRKSIYICCKNKDCFDSQRICKSENGLNLNSTVKLILPAVLTNKIHFFTLRKVIL